MIKIRGIFRQDKRICNGNELCNITFSNLDDFKKWVHNNCDIVAGAYIQETNYNKCKSIDGFLLADSEYNKAHLVGYAQVKIYLITETIPETKYNEYNEPEESESELILYSNGKHTDGNEHISELFKKMLCEINKKEDRSKFNFA